MGLRTIIAVIFFMSFQITGFTYDNEIDVECIFTFIYNQQFDEADSMLLAQKGKLDPFYSLILKTDLLWWKYIKTHSKHDSTNLENILDSFIITDTETTVGKISRLINSSYQLRYDLKNYKFVSAFILRSDIKKQIAELKNEKLPFYDVSSKFFDFYLSLFQYSDNSINPFSINIKSKASLNSLVTLEKYSYDEDLILSTLAHYFLGRIYTTLEKRTEEGQTHFKILADRFPKNSLFDQLSKGLNPKF